MAGRLNDQEKIQGDESSVNNSAGSSTDNKLVYYLKNIGDHNDSVWVTYLDEFCRKPSSRGGAPFGGYSNFK